MTSIRNLGSLVFPIDDESGYGVLCRYALLMGYRDLNSLVGYLLGEDQKGTDGRTLDDELSALVIFVSQVWDLSPMDALDRFSNLPLHRPFSANKLVLASLSVDGSLAMTGHAIVRRRIARRENNANGILGWRPLGVADNYPQYCPQCAREQYERYGFSTWLRSHNVSGVSVCHIHARHLLRTPTRGLFLPAFAKDEYLPQKSEVSPHELKYARYVRALLDHNLPWLAHDTRARLLRRRLFELDEAEAASAAPDLRRLLTSPKVQAIFWPSDKVATATLSTIVSVLMALFEDVTVLRERFHCASSASPESSSEVVDATAGQRLTLQVVAGEGE